jgi:hypothetical protein
LEKRTLRGRYSNSLVIDAGSQFSLRACSQAISPGVNSRAELVPSPRAYARNGIIIYVKRKPTLQFRYNHIAKEHIEAKRELDDAENLSERFSIISEHPKQGVPHSIEYK